ncbi:MAG: hypothetical protein ABFD89_09920 [Bryobacteraceae bacterium]
MSNNPQISYAACDAEANALRVLMNSGKLRIYSGAVPTRCDDSIGSAISLVELTMNATAFGASSSGVITANSITSAVASVDGDASFFRIWDSAGTTAYIQGTVGTATADLIIGSIRISAGATVSVTSLTHTVVRGA